MKTLPILSLAISCLGFAEGYPPSLTTRTLLQEPLRNSIVVNGTHNSATNVSATMGTDVQSLIGKNINDAINGRFIEEATPDCGNVAENEGVAKLEGTGNFIANAGMMGNALSVGTTDMTGDSSTGEVLMEANAKCSEELRMKGSVVSTGKYMGTENPVWTAGSLLTLGVDRWEVDGHEGGKASGDGMIGGAWVWTEDWNWSAIQEYWQLETLEVDCDFDCDDFKNCLKKTPFYFLDNNFIRITPCLKTLAKKMQKAASKMPNSLDFADKSPNLAQNRPNFAKNMPNLDEQTTQPNKLAAISLHARPQTQQILRLNGTILRNLEDSHWCNTIPIGPAQTILVRLPQLDPTYFPTDISLFNISLPIATPAGEDGTNHRPIDIVEARIVDIKGAPHLDPINCRWRNPFTWGITRPRSSDFSEPISLKSVLDDASFNNLRTFKDPVLQIRTGATGGFLVGPPRLALSFSQEYIQEF